MVGNTKNRKKDRLLWTFRTNLYLRVRASAILRVQEVN